jgi:hypothetical protein
VDAIDGVSGGLTAVSCPTTSFCMAVDEDSNRSVMFSGGSWSAPIPASSGYGLEAVSCPSTSFCVAVDDNADVLTWHS